MTMIGQFVLDQVGVLIGDLMLSSTIRPATAISSPTHGLISDPIAKDRFYAGLMQKVCILNDKLIVAWSGSLLSAKVALRTLKEELSNREVTPAAIEGALKKVAPDHFRDLELIGLYKAPDDMKSFTANVSIFTPEGGVAGLTNCCVGGSGAGKLYYEFSLGSIDYDQEENVIRRAVSYGHSVIGGVIGEEVAMGGDNLERAFGGGYELALFDANGPLKIGDILYLFWIWDKEKDELPQLISLMIKADYIGSDLILQRIYSEPEERTGRFVIRDRRNYAVRTPLDPERTFEQLGYKTPELTPYYLSCTYLCCNKGGTRILTTRKTSQYKNSHVAVTDAADGIRLQFNDEYRKAELGKVTALLATDPIWNA